MSCTTVKGWWTFWILMVYFMASRIAKTPPQLDSPLVTLPGFPLFCRVLTFKLLYEWSKTVEVVKFDVCIVLKYGNWNLKRKDLKFFKLIHDFVASELTDAANDMNISYFVFLALDIILCFIIAFSKIDLNENPATFRRFSFFLSIFRNDVC
jgi:hypothetical protein